MGERADRDLVDSGLGDRADRLERDAAGGLEAGPATGQRDGCAKLVRGHVVEQDRVRAASHLPVEVECDTIEQVSEALDAGVDAILLDNMTLDELRSAVALAGGRARLEASGGITLESIRAVAETGVDEISVGALTHSARSLDVSLALK